MKGDTANQTANHERWVLPLGTVSFNVRMYVRRWQTSSVTIFVTKNQTFNNLKGDTVWEVLKKHWQDLKSSLTFDLGIWESLGLGLRLVNLGLTSPASPFMIDDCLFQLTAPGPRSLRPPAQAAGPSSTPGSPGGRSVSSLLFTYFPILPFTIIRFSFIIALA